MRRMWLLLLLQLLLLLLMGRLVLGRRRRRWRRLSVPLLIPPATAQAIGVAVTPALQIWACRRWRGHGSHHGSGARRSRANPRLIRLSYAPPKVQGRLGRQRDAKVLIVRPAP